MCSKKKAQAYVKTNGKNVLEPENYVNLNNLYRLYQEFKIGLISSSHFSTSKHGQLLFAQA